MDPNTVFDGCAWLTPARVERLRLEWRLFARVLDNGAIYVKLPGVWIAAFAPSFAVGIEYGLEQLITLGGGVGGPAN